MADSGEAYGVSEPETSDTVKDRYLTFYIDSEQYGIEISDVQTLISMTAITKIPDNPDYVEGIINLRGEIIGVLDIRKRFQKPPKEYDELTCIIVIAYGGLTLGLIVDSVNEVITIAEDSIVPPPSAKLNSYNRFIRNIANVEGGVKLLLDLERLLARE
ncbi:MAG: chemotaxis protein CheW [Firmicutes bacterium]|nr:chemotaxis protein CheW [Bacillota bacterium]